MRTRVDVGFPATVRQAGFEFLCLGKKFLVFNLVSRNLKTKYHRSVVGIFWTLLTPLAMTAIYYFVFKIVLNVQVPHYLVFILSGVLPWTFFSQSVSEGMESIVSNQGLVTKVPVPLQVLPFVGTLTNLVTLLLSLPIVLGAALISGVELGASLLLVPLYFGALFLMAYSVALILSVAFVYFRDLRHLLGLLMQLWFYGTPVIYQEQMIPVRFSWVLYVNPVGPIFVGLHDILVRGRWPEGQQVLAALAWTLATVGAALLVQKKYLRGVVERI